MQFLLFALGKEGSVTGVCLYLGSLNRGCKGWEGSRGDLYYGLPGKRGKVQGFLSFGYRAGIAVIHTTSRRRRSTF